MSDHPPQGLTTAANVVRVVDGDTIDVEVRRVLRVRLLNCWAPETKGAEREAGEAARLHLLGLIQESGDRVIVHVPASQDGELQDVFTLGRVLGEVWPASGGDSLSRQMVQDGFACRVKPVR